MSSVSPAILLKYLRSAVDDQTRSCQCHRCGSDHSYLVHCSTVQIIYQISGSVDTNVSYRELMRIHLTLKSLSSEKVSTMIPKIMFRPIVVTMMKKETSYNNLQLASLKSPDTSGIIYKRRATHMWQSRVDNKHYSISYFDRVCAFET